MFSVVAVLVQAQNLVLNPSFECGQDECEPTINPFWNDRYACYWRCPTNGTSDVYSTKIGNKACYSYMPYSGEDRNDEQIHVGSQMPFKKSQHAGVY